MARRKILVGALATVLLGGAAARAAEPEAAVLAAQDKRVALTIAADVTALGAMMTDDLTYTHSSAIVDSKAEFLEAIRSGKYKYKSMTFEDRRVRFHGDVAIVSGTTHVQVTSSGKDLDIRLRFTELYAKEAGAWKMALWHSARLPDPAP
jgi:ketosteroid isomerase-like protein